MDDPKVPFSDTTARRAQLMQATERFKSSIQDNVDSLKSDASEIGKTTALVAGVAFGVFLLANLILPKSDEYRRAEKYGEWDDDDEYTEYDDEDDDDEPVARRQPKSVQKQAKETQRSAAASGLIGGLLTSVLTNIAKEQLSGLLTRIRTNNAINPTAQHADTQYHEKASTQPADYANQS
ncbi:hypothetical protein FAES_5224 [Fibrella aestuarina BUZ 2]|uniref:Uncharacterized protein n=1 Tax=Fibrella aestuarina BUZ 2 TaxID=1166018 RepID=I0KGH0_9BACT|nr:hypothetical protein [Fibrella aestuarina]CCH03223.1 hypothetical protein FAES_5224 [Fibrella aestuarina BUZ 2]